jgi:hypothetical protein
MPTKSPQGLATLSLTSPAGVVTERSLPTASVNPNLFTNYRAAYATCDGGSILSEIPFSNLPALAGRDVYALVLNADGTINSCSNPAQVESKVTVLVNAAGAEPPSVSDATGNSISGVHPFGSLFDRLAELAYLEIECRRSQRILERRTRGAAFTPFKGMAWLENWQLVGFLFSQGGEIGAAQQSLADIENLG